MSDAMSTDAKPTTYGSPEDIRAEGWDVAVHNDYRLNGEHRTFWLFTKGSRAVKGEGRTDAEALDEVRIAIRFGRSVSCSACHARAPEVCLGCIVDVENRRPNAIEAMLRRVLKSAVPNRREHPTMHAAWREAEKLLGIPRSQSNALASADEPNEERASHEKNPAQSPRLDELHALRLAVTFVLRDACAASECQCCADRVRQTEHYLSLAGLDPNAYREAGS